MNCLVYVLKYLCLKKSLVIKIKIFCKKISEKNIRHIYDSWNPK